MKFFIRNGDHSIPVDIDELPESAMFFDEKTKQEARSTLAAAFAILLGVPCYVTFESDSKERDDPDGDALMYDHEEGMETRG